MRNSSMRHQGGFVLQEQALNIVLILAAGIGLFFLFNFASGLQKASSLRDSVVDMATAIRAEYRAPYAGLSAANMISNESAPKGLISGTALSNSFGGAITTGPAIYGGGTANNAFYIENTLVPKSACTKLGKAARTSFKIVVINGTTVKDESAGTDLGDTGVDGECDQTANIIRVTDVG